MSRTCIPCGGNVNYIVPQPSSVQPGGGDAETPTTPELSECPVHFIEISEPFDFPAPGETAIIRSCCSDGLTDGAVLYSIGMGYLHVSDIPNECEIEVINLGEICNIKEAGEPVEAGTKLQIGIPVCVSASEAEQKQICLTTDFFVPDYCDAPTDTGGCCRNVGVTSVTGLVVGQRLALGQREFRLTEIISATLIRICNDGAGGLPGAVVYAMDDCFEIIGGANVCDRETVDGGMLLACRDGEQRPIGGSYDGQIPQWSNELQRFVLVAAPPLPTCTSLDADFTVDETNPVETNYVIDVFDSSNFVVNGSLQINESGGTLRRFSVITIIDGTHLRVHPVFTVTTNTTFHAGASVCQVEDKCALTALPANEQVIGGILACIDGNSKPIAPSEDNKIIVGKDTLWVEASRGLGFYARFISLYNGEGDSVVTYEWDALDIPAMVGNEQIYAEIEVWASISGATGGRGVVEINGVSYATLYTNGVGADPPGGGAQQCRFTTKVLATAGAGNQISMRIYLLQGSALLTGTITLVGYFA